MDPLIKLKVYKELDLLEIKAEGIYENKGSTKEELNIKLAFVRKELYTLKSQKPDLYTASDIALYQEIKKEIKKDIEAVTKNEEKNGKKLSHHGLLNLEQEQKSASYFTALEVKPNKARNVEVDPIMKVAALFQTKTGQRFIKNINNKDAREILNERIKQMPKQERKLAKHVKARVEYEADKSDSSFRREYKELYKTFSAKEKSDIREVRAQLSKHELIKK
jgi:hypothetical protein